jgi:tRNA-dihydrouridine synthase
LPPIITLAPLHGVTNRVFRKAYFHHFTGFDAAMAPFIAAVKPGKLPERHFKDLSPREDNGIRLVPQVLGNEAGGFVATARLLADLGYDEVNWNLGCPFPVVANKGRGSGLLPFPDLIARFLDEACAASALPLSVKLRLGRRDPGEILALMPILNAHPLARVIIHPRVGIQMYRGEVDLEGFAAAAALSTHEVVFNGDIKDARTFETLRSRFPAVREWMIGRWAISDPFLVGKLKAEPRVRDRLGTLRAFHDELYAGYREVLYGPAHVLDKMKEIWSLLGKSFPKAGKQLGRISQARTFEAYERAVDGVFSAAGAGSAEG